MKRICASFLAIVMLFATYGYASAVNVTSSRASLTLSRYFAEALTGSGRGEIIISYDVKSSKIATSVGVESIVFYTEGGDYVTSVSGSTRNGLVKTNNDNNAGDFKYDLPSGKYYYAEVTVFARVGSDYDSRTVTTSTVWVR